MPTLIKTPAHLTSRYLQSKLLCGTPQTDFVAKVGKVGDRDDNGVYCTDYGDHSDGRDLRSGEVFRKPLVQVLVRALDYPTAVIQIKKIMDQMDSLLPSDFEVFDFEDEAIHIQNFCFQSGPMYLGQEEKNLRESFSANYQLTLKSF